MLDSITTVLQAIWQQDFTALHAPGIALSIYVCIFSFIFLESALLPAAPLPCDSVVILSGTLAGMGILNPWLVFLLLFVAAAAGSYLAFVQGRLLNRLPKVQGWVYKVPPDSLAAVDKLLARHGLVALFCARFLPLVRSLLPLVMGVRMACIKSFYFFAALSAFFWVGLLVSLGYMMPFLPERISKLLTMVLMAAPVITLVLALGSWLTYKLLRKPQDKQGPHGQF
ncbi:DedA family protein [Shewanella indica]|uniref:DedA family protein n=1 Tax=Shewanella indica TaxID=768528 RepID=UPI001BF0AB0E|nr:DedA family protein [Shewanella indica]MCE9791934.1 DedA family protein [Shewanella indica]BCV35191.1 membrane protein [Shewanella chilikensis]